MADAIESLPDWLEVSRYLSCITRASNYYEFFSFKFEIYLRKKLGIGKEADDGVFWMSWADALEEFEQITICHLDGDDEVERRCIGIELNSD